MQYLSEVGTQRLDECAPAVVAGRAGFLAMAPANAARVSVPAGSAGTARSVHQAVKLTKSERGARSATTLAWVAPPPVPEPWSQDFSDAQPGTRARPSGPSRPVPRIADGAIQGPDLAMDLRPHNAIAQPAKKKKERFR